MSPAMRNQSEYHLHLASAPDQRTAAKVFGLVWRFDFTAPGFCLLDLGPGVDTHTLRSWMVDLKRRLSELSFRRDGLSFVFRSLARFDQQETTKFHLDGAPEQSMLMLGYEPSRVASRLFLADYSRAAFDLGSTPQQFLQDFNPMYRRGEELLSRYVTELPQPEDGHARILLVNNSSQPFAEGRKNQLGVVHKAIVVTPDEAERRIVNSTMLTVGDREGVGQEQEREFVTTDKISKKTY
jgi:hypothetical protein